MNTFAASLMLVGLGLTLVLSAIAVFFLRGPEERGPAPLTRFFLVALRLSIGWHFFVEGMDKLHSASWSSEAYLRESTGPLAPKFRELAGDRLIDKVTLGEGDAFPPELEADWRAYLDAVISFYGLDADQAKQASAVLEDAKKRTTVWLKAKTKDVQKSPENPSYPMTIPERIKAYHAMERDIRDIEEVQLPKYGSDVFPKLKSAKASLNKWRGELKADLDRQTAEYKGELRDQVLVIVALEALPPDQQFKALDGKIREMETKLKGPDAKIAAKIEAAVAAKYGKGAVVNLKAAVEELSKSRADLKADLAQKTAFKTATRNQILRGTALDQLPDEYRMEPLEAKEPMASIQASYSQLLQKKIAGADVKLPPQGVRVFEYALDKRQEKESPTELLPAGSVPPGRPRGAWTNLDWSDFLVKWGITLTGVCLLLGLLTRLACLTGAALLLMFFLAMPPLPGWPESPRAEGHYLYINKNIIEMLALLTLATTRSGKWVGLDGLLQFLCPWCWKNPPPAGRLDRAVNIGEEPTVAINPGSKD